MLILTDRAQRCPDIHNYLARARRCDIVDLHETQAQASDYPVVICDVAISDEGSVRDLGAAIKRHRRDAAVPVLFLARDRRHVTAAAARSLGATELVASTAAPALILAAAERLIESYQSRKQGSLRSAGKTQAQASDAKSVLADCFSAAKQGEAVSIAELNKGAGIVLTAIRQTKVRKWLDVVRQYDDITYQHCLLVAGLVAALSLKLGLTQNHQHLLSQAALIHDVGKARVPPSILNKAGPLTPAEMEVMRGHAALGHEMLVRQGGINPVILDVVRHHHEYCDGSGYPDRLRGSQISGYVRITTICDIYAALIERRPYKSPMPPKQALATLASLGAKLDAELLQSFAAVISADG